MKFIVVLAALVSAASSGSLAAQEPKPVPKDSMRVSVQGCSKGLVFTAGPRLEDQPGRADIPEGMHLRMQGPKKILSEIKAHEGSVVEITGLVRKGQYGPSGVGIGGGVRIGPGTSPTGGSLMHDPGAGQTVIDVEGWRSMIGTCRSS